MENFIQANLRINLGTDFQETEDSSQTLFHFLIHLSTECVFPTTWQGVQNANGNIDHVSSKELPVLLGTSKMNTVFLLMMRILSV